MKIGGRKLTVREGQKLMGVSQASIATTVMVSIALKKCNMPLSPNPPIATMRIGRVVSIAKGGHNAIMGITSLASIAMIAMNCIALNMPNAASRKENQDTFTKEQEMLVQMPIGDRHSITRVGQNAQQERQWLGSIAVTATSFIASKKLDAARMSD
jgi:hypothetical protein